MLATWLTEFLQTIESEIPPTPGKHHFLYCPGDRLVLVLGTEDSLRQFTLSDSHTGVPVRSAAAAGRAIVAVIRGQQGAN